MHWIQKDILKKLTVKNSLRYIELKPKDVDGNLFMYHLNQLTFDKYVQKDKRGYTLTKEGKRHVGSISLSSGNPTRLPRVVTMIYCVNSEKETLLYRWNRQPYLGHVSLPFNRVRFGQSVFNAAAETLKFKTNLAGTLKYVGDAYAIIKDNDNVTAHYLAHIFILSKFSGDLYADGLTGQPFWGKIQDYSGSDFVHGTKEIINVIKNKKPPFFEEVIVKKP